MNAFFKSLAYATAVLSLVYWAHMPSRSEVERAGLCVEAGHRYSQQYLSGSDDPSDPAAVAYDVMRAVCSTASTDLVKSLSSERYPDLFTGHMTHWSKQS